MPVIGFFLCSLKLEQERVAEKHDMMIIKGKTQTGPRPGLGRGEEARSSKFRLPLLVKSKNHAPNWPSFNTTLEGNQTASPAADGRDSAR
jgi:hypothetical protein